MGYEIVSIRKADDRKGEFNISKNVCLFEVDVKGLETGDAYTVFVTVEYKEDNDDHRLVLDGFCTSLEIEKCGEIAEFVLSDMKQYLEKWKDAIIKEGEKLLNKTNNKD